MVNIEFLIENLSYEKPSEFLRSNSEKIFQIIPELFNCKNFNKNNPWHVYDVFEHILHVVDGVPNNKILRIAALFHDVGKPFVYIEDQNGIGHFYDHWNKSKEIFDNFAKKCNLEESEKELISNLILYHDINIDKLSDKQIDELLKVFDKEGIIMLFQLKRSDLLAQNKEFHYILDNYEKQEKKILNKKR